jgi:8-oxo-dGTP diphosphatase
MDEKHVLKKIKELGETLPKFPDGRINYTDSKYAPIIVVFVRYRGKFLLLKRSQKVGNYKGKWNTISGYLDTIEPIEQKAIEELEEETRISRDIISSLTLGKIHEHRDSALDTKWLICPFLAELKSKPRIELDFEHTEYVWCEPNDINKFDTVKSLSEDMRTVL